MKFAVVNPKDKTVERIESHDAHEVERAAGLPHLQTDSGILVRLPTGGGLGYVVHEHGLFVPPVEQFYCALFGRLIAGTVVLYEFDEGGYTVTLDDQLTIEPVWFDDADDVERAIAARIIERPQMAFGGEVIWQWPAPRPTDDELRAMQERIADALTKGPVQIDDTIIAALPERKP